MKIPRLLLAAPKSGSGKTMITCGLLNLLKRQKKRVAAFKCGPDYIDPMFHSQVLGIKSRNLDSFFTDEEETKRILINNSRGFDIAVIEGVMGYYDGLGGFLTKASSFDVARITKTPTVLIVDCQGMSLSVLAQIGGFLDFEKESRIEGIILNRCSPMIYKVLKEMIEERYPVKVVGYVPKLDREFLKSRHLGLMMPEEIKGLAGEIDHLSDVLEQCLDMEALFSLAESAQSLKTNAEIHSDTDDVKVRIAVARDQAFCFIYEDNLEILRELGAEIVPFSPLKDQELPEGIGGVIFYGGYPELYAKELSTNQSMRESVKEKLAKGLPVMAECGGFMYLHETLEGMDGQTYPMVGAIKGRAFDTKKLSRFGYVTLEGSTVFGKKAGMIPAHEFHYFDTTNNGDAFVAKKASGKRQWPCMISTETMFAGFPHLYYRGNPLAAKAFLCQSRVFGEQGSK